MSVPSDPDPAGRLRIAILGSTGSIGTQTLDVVAAHPDRFQVVGLAAARNERLLSLQAERFRAQLVCMTESPRPGWLTGQEGLLEVATHPLVDLLVVAVTGAAGWEPTLAAIRAGKQIALANKEALVVAGSVIGPEARKHNTILRPIDSEHSALWQCLQGEGLNESYLTAPRNVRRLLLTASGGPFRTTRAENLGRVTAADALAHPTWTMGAKVTIDSATLMNKGLEMIEAHWLFDIEYSRIDVVVHPQSVVHSMVEFEDGAVKAQLGVPDMRLPIQYALAYPDHLPSPGLPRLDWSQRLDLQFEPPDTDRFPALRLAREAGEVGGTAPAVLSAADEVAVAAFLAGRIGFMDIPALVDRALAVHTVVSEPSLDDLRGADIETRKQVEAWIRSGALTLRA